MSFDLDKWLKQQDPKILSSSAWERYLTAPVKPTLLEGVGLNPAKVLGQGDYKNYVYGRGNDPFGRPSPFDRSSPFGPAPLSPPSPFGR